MEEYVCPRCSDKYNNKYDANIWFLENAGYIKLGTCPKCKTDEELNIINSTWKAYRQSMEEDLKNA
jgi:ribosomal protein L37AE/L43A